MFNALIIFQKGDYCGEWFSIGARISVIMALYKLGKLL